MAGEREGHAAELAPTDFSTFVISLGSSCLMHLGLAAPEGGGEAGAPDLDLAQQTIDILRMLQDKTAGNLTEEEQSLLQGVLYQVRMAFVDVRGRNAP